MAKNVVTGLGNLATQGAASSIASSAGISHDNIIFGMLLLLFVVYITLKVELGTYMRFFTPTGALGSSAVPVTVGGTTSTAGERFACIQSRYARYAARHNSAAR